MAAVILPPGTLDRSSTRTTPVQASHDVAVKHLSATRYRTGLVGMCPKAARRVRIMWPLARRLYR
jgi:hypothetical protein